MHVAAVCGPNTATWQQWIDQRDGTVVGLTSQAARRESPPADETFAKGAP